MSARHPEYMRALDLVVLQILFESLFIKYAFHLSVETWSFKSWWREYSRNPPRSVERSMNLLVTPMEALEAGWHFDETKSSICGFHSVFPVLLLKMQLKKKRLLPVRWTLMTADVWWFDITHSYSIIIKRLEAETEIDSGKRGDERLVIWMQKK